jgi:type III pantothenate kinase
MLLVIDVGNTQTALGLFQQDTLKAHWRISTRHEETADEIAVIISDLLALENVSLQDVQDVAISSVVPSCTLALKEMVEKTIKRTPLIVGKDTNTGITIRYENPAEVGADRLVNAVAGFELYGGPLIIVDFGTATTFDAISEKAEYLGGVIAPGIEISAEALFSRAARLHRVELKKPATVIGKNTIESMQSGIIYGQVGLVDTIVLKMKKELKRDCHVVATGGLATLIAPECKTIETINPLLTLIGLQKIYAKNQ